MKNRLEFSTAKKLIGTITTFILIQGTLVAGPIDDLGEQARKKYDAINKFFDSGTRKNFLGANKLRIASWFFEVEKPEGQILLVNGWSESSRKYAELIQDFNEAGYSVYTLDHRGQGLSERLNLLDSQIIHLDKFKHYISDLAHFSNKLIPRNKDLPLHIVSHSTGGLIVAHALAQGKIENPGQVALVSPNFGLNLGKTPLWAVHKLLDAKILLGLGPNYGPSQGPFDFKGAKFKGNTGTQSIFRFRVKKQMWLDYPKSTTSGSSNVWIKQILRAIAQLDAQAKNIKEKTLLFTATMDALVDTKKHPPICKKMPSCKQVTYQGKHELLHEVAKVRDEVIEEIIEHIES